MWLELVYQYLSSTNKLIPAQHQFSKMDKSKYTTINLSHTLVPVALLIGVVVMYLVLLNSSCSSPQSESYDQPSEQSSPALENFLDRIENFQHGENDYSQEDREIILKRGYLKSMTGHCATLKKGNILLGAVNCSESEESLAVFEYTSHHRLKVNGFCVTHIDQLVFLDLCSKQHNGQRWSVQEHENFIVTTDDLENPYGACIYLISEGTGGIKLIALDCWYNCNFYHFRPVTWWIVDSPSWLPSQVELDRMERLRHEPWQKRYCVHYDKTEQD